MSVDFVVAVTADAVNFNDAYRNYVGTAGYLVAANMYNRVILREWYNYDTPVPDLATHWERLDGARRWRFHLNQAARWHDGTPLTAHDVAYTHTHVKAMGYTGAAYFDHLDRVEAVNDHTVDYYLTEPNNAFTALLGILISSHIVPRHLWEGTDWSQNPHLLRPVGSGPFRFVEWEPGRHIILEAVKDHWGARPEIDRLIYRVCEDRDAAVRMVARGDAHHMPQDVLTFDRLPMLADATAPVEVHRVAGPGMAALEFNQREPLFADRRRRAAVAHAIDRTAFSGGVDPGLSQLWDRYQLDVYDWAFNPDAVAPAYDPARAVALLDESGLPRGADGTRADLRLHFLTAFDGHRGLTATVAQQLEAVGFRVRHSGLDPVDWAARVGRERAFDLLVVGGGMTPDPEVNAPRYTTHGRNNYGGHANPEIDELYRRARAATTRAERGAHYKALQALFAREVAWVPLFWYALYMARSTEFFGWTDQLDYSIPYWHYGRIRPADRIRAPQG